MYSPAIMVARTLQTVPLGANHRVELLDRIISAGRVQYAFIAAVIDHRIEKACLFVSSEVNAAPPEHRSGSHFFCMFVDESHKNFGASDEWGDATKFFPAAVALAARHVGVEPPVFALQDATHTMPSP